VRKIRTTPISINALEVLLGVHWILLIVLFAISVLFTMKVSFRFGIGFFLASFIGSQVVTKIDEKLLQIFVDCWNFPLLLDPLLRENFEVEITED
jgi:hypothetical protein